MKKGCIFFIIIALIIPALLVAIPLATAPKKEEYIPYCQEINELIKNEDFEFAEIGETIRLYSYQFGLIKEIPFDKYQKRIRLSVYVTDKEAGCICFATSRAVDDDFGYAIINNAEKNERVRFLCAISHHGKSIEAHYEISGINELTHIKDNVYKYSTMYPKWLDD